MLLGSKPRVSLYTVVTTGLGRMKEVDTGKAYRLFYPSVPAVLSASHRKTVSAMLVVSFTALSESPSLVGVSSLPSHSTHKTVIAARRFSLCWLDKKDIRAMAHLASHAGKEGEDKLLSAGLKHHRGKRVDVPVIDAAVAVLECSLTKTIRFGDHELLVGRVKASYAIEDFRDYWSFEVYRPILYTGWRGDLATLD